MIFFNCGYTTSNGTYHSDRLSDFNKAIKAQHDIYDELGDNKKLAAGMIIHFCKKYWLKIQNVYTSRFSAQFCVVPINTIWSDKTDVFSGSFKL